MTACISRLRVIEKTTAYTLTTADNVILVDASAGAVTITLPTAVGNEGQEFHIQKIDSSTNAVTITPFGTETINGVASSVTLNRKGTGTHLIAQEETLTGWATIPNGLLNDILTLLDLTVERQFTLGEITQNVTAISQTITTVGSIQKLVPDATYILSAEPIIANGSTGQLLLLKGSGAFTVTLTHGSAKNLSLNAATRDIKAETVLALMWTGTDWVELFYFDSGNFRSRVTGVFEGNLDVTGTATFSGPANLDGTNTITGLSTFTALATFAAAVALNGPTTHTGQAVITPTSATAITDASDDISGTIKNVIKLTSDSLYVLTSTPTINETSIPHIEGKIIILTNIGSNRIVLQDNATLSGSNLILTANTRVLKPSRYIGLISIGGLWQEFISNDITFLESLSIAETLDVTGVATFEDTTNLDGPNFLTGVNTFTGQNIYPSTAATAITDAGDDIAGTIANVIKLTADFAYTLTSTPTINETAVEPEDGTIITLINLGSNNITLQDEATLPGSLLQLKAATRVLAPESIIVLLRIGASWFEVSFSG